MQQVYYLIQKEFRQVFRDKAMIGMLLIVPLLQVIILGYSITTDVTSLKIVIFDGDRTPVSRDFTRKFMHIEYFEYKGTERSYSNVVHALDVGSAQLAVVIPKNFHRDIVRGDKPVVQLLTDGIDGNSAGVALGYVAGIATDYQFQLIASQPALGAPMRRVRIASAEPRFWYNPELESRIYIVPGLVALILLIITVFLTSMGIVREKEIGTLEQLMVTPIRSWQLILGKIVPFIILGFAEIVLAIGFIYLVFGIGVKGSLLLLFAESAIFIFTTLGFGIFVSTISETQQQALFVAWFFMIFAILLSGFFIPIANMPDAIQVITYLNPLRYFLVIIREIYLKDTSLKYLLPETLAMAGFGFAMFSMAVLRFRRLLN